MRELADHKTNELNEGLRIAVIDEPGSGGANHVYAIEKDPIERHPLLVIKFQDGPIKETGINGVTQEVLLAVVIDRLRSFQAGAYANTFNAEALKHCEIALAALKARTNERVERGAEGTHTV